MYYQRKNVANHEFYNTTNRHLISKNKIIFQALINIFIKQLLINNVFIVVTEILLLISYYNSSLIENDIVNLLLYNLYANRHYNK